MASTAVTTSPPVAHPSAVVLPFRRDDPDLAELLESENWRQVGVTCRIAYASSVRNDLQLRTTFDGLIGDGIDVIEQLFTRRERHRKVLQRMLALLRLVERREDAALGHALAARGF